MNLFLNELRYGVRSLTKKPGMTIVSILALSLGIGLTTTMFSIVNGIIFSELPVEKPDRIVTLNRVDEANETEIMEVPVRDFEEWEKRQKSFQGLAGFTIGTINVSDEASPRRYDGAFISANFLEVLKVKPLLGRGFLKEEDDPKASPAVLLGYTAWQDQFLGDPSIVGKEVFVNGEKSRVVGVMGKGFNFPRAEEVWVPLRPIVEHLDDYTNYSIMVFGRLSDGVSMKEAETDLKGMAGALAKQHPETNAGIGAVIKPFAKITDKETVWCLYILLAAGFFVLFIACANVANLLLARSTLRGREMAIRSALGATRPRIIFQLLMESLVLAAFGALGGLILTSWQVDYLWTEAQKFSPFYWMDFKIDSAVILFVVLTTVLSGLIAGILPAWQASKTDLNLLLKEANRTSSSSRIVRFNRLLAGTQIALSSALLIGAGLTLKSVLSAKNLKLRYDPSHYLTARMGLFEADYPKPEDRIRFYRNLVWELKKRKDVVDAAVTSWISLHGADRLAYALEGEKPVEGEETFEAFHEVVSPGYFSTYGLDVKEGRNFDLRDEKPGAERVTIVNRSFLRRHWPGESPLGKRFQILKEKTPEKSEWLKIVGVVNDLKTSGFDTGRYDEANFYIPLAQEDMRFMSVVLHTRGKAALLGPMIKEEVLKLDPRLPLYFVKTMEEYIEDITTTYRLIASTFTTLGLVAVFLASIGIYGMMSFSVNQRTREIGIRLAMGAQRKSIIGLILKQSVWHLLLGLGVGLSLAYAVFLQFSAVLYHAKPLDFFVFLVVMLILTAVALIACLIPTRRAINIHPMNALRYE